MSGAAVVGEATDTHAPVLLLYTTPHATKVVPYYGRMVLDRLTADDIGGREVKAMSARKTGESKVDAGRHLVDYWPAYGDGQPSTGMRSERFWGLVGDAGKCLQETSLSLRVSDVRRALLLVLRAAGAPLAQDLRDARALPRAASAVAPTGPLEGLTRQLALSGDALSAGGQRAALLQLLYEGLKTYLPDGLEFDAFKDLDAFDETKVPGAKTAAATTTCEVSHRGRNLEFGLGTVAGMKGETHAASLVLESYGGTSRKFDVALGLEYIAGVASKKLAQLPKTQQAQMRNLYVAMSRPTKLLCLAANESRVPQRLRDALAVKGWHIETVA